jgi:hypothetical protein
MRSPNLDEEAQDWRDHGAASTQLEPLVCVTTARTQHPPHDVMVSDPDALARVLLGRLADVAE